MASQDHKEKQLFENTKTTSQDMSREVKTWERMMNGLI